VTIENNLFGHTVDGGAGGDWHYFGLAWWLETLNGARVVNNTFENPVSMDRTDSGDGVWANNIGGGWECVPGVTYAGNVGKSCGSKDKAVSPSSSAYNKPAPMGWVSPNTFDFHLLANSPAVDAGRAEYAPATDREGNPRSGLPDAGAYEYDSGRPPTPPGGGGNNGGGKSGRLRISVARLRPAVICRHRRHGCPSTARLKLVLSKKARVTVRLARMHKPHGAKPVRTLRRKAIRRGTIRIRARGLARGVYRVRVIASAGGARNARSRALRVRR
jgi:hypothetical protein